MIIHRKKKGSSQRKLVAIPLSLVVLVVIAFALGLGGAGFLLSTSDNLQSAPQDVLKTYVGRLGRNAFEDTDSLSSTLLKFPANYIKASWNNPDIPQLVFDIKFKHMQKLRAKRLRALEKGMLIQEKGDFVPAQIGIGDKKVKVKVRLKGDRLDHLQDEKWSLRVEVKGRDQVLGMRRFSIQHPKTRGFQAEPLFMETLQYMGVLAVRYQFVKVVINGDPIGIMAVEEHFSKELLENQARREGIIMRFNESLFWEHDNLGANFRQSAFNSFRNAKIDAFREKKIRKSPALTAQYQTAVGMLRGFTSDHLPASDVFDIDATASYLAVLELWGSWHGIQWNDMRFYVNPLSLKLEPIGYDANLKLHSDLDELTLLREPIRAALLKDPVIRGRYLVKLQELCDSVINGEFGKHLAQIQDSQVSLLKDEFYFLKQLDLSKLKKRASFLAKLNESELMEIPRSFPRRVKNPTLIHANLIEDSSGRYLEIANALTEPVTIESISWRNGNDVASAVQILPSERMPMQLEPTFIRQAPVFQRIELEASSDVENSDVVIVATHPGWPHPVEIQAENYFPELSNSPLPQSSSDLQINQHSFITQNLTSKILSIMPGQWQVKTDIVVPRGYSLSIKPGTTLEFDKDKALIAYGPLLFMGTKNSPVVMRGIADNNWQGVAVMHSEKKSHWQHVQVSGTEGIKRNAWQLTGGVTFYRSNVLLENVAISKHRGEDALNIVNSNFSIQGLDINDTISDALDLDFSDGNIKDSIFTNIGYAGGGDGIDISGSNVAIDNIKFDLINDKAISVGEKSQMTANNITMGTVGTGAACKDGSSLKIDQLVIRKAKVAGLMAYTKKPEYGAAIIEAVNVQYDTIGPIGRTQIGNRIILNDIELAAENLDVDELYDTVMSKGKK